MIYGESLMKNKQKKMKNIPYWLRSKEISDLIDTKCMLNWQRYN